MEIVFLPSSEPRQEQVIQITVIDDIFVENDENFTSLLSLSVADPSVDLNPGEASILIKNDDGAYTRLLTFCGTNYAILSWGRRDHLIEKPSL